MKKNSIIYALGLVLATASLAGCKPAAPSLTGIEITKAPTVTLYDYDVAAVSLDGIEVSAVYSDESKQVITEYEHSTLTPTDAQRAAGQFTVTLTYQDFTAKQKFTFRDVDHYVEWPAHRVNELIKDYKGDDNVPAWNGAFKEFVVEDDYWDVQVVMPDGTTDEQKEAAVEAYNAALLSTSNGYKEAGTELNDYGYVSAHNTIDACAYIWSTDGEIYVKFKPHQASDYFAELFTETTDKLPEALKNLDENAFADAYLGYFPYVYFGVADEEAAEAKGNALIASLLGEAYFPYYEDSYGDQHFASPNEEIDICGYYSEESEAIIVSLDLIDAEDKEYTQGDAFPSDAIHTYFGDDLHTTVPALAGAQKYLSKASAASFDLLMRYELATGAAAAAETFVASLATDFDRVGGEDSTTFLSKNGSVKLELAIVGRYFAVQISDAAVFPLDAVNAFIDEEYTEAQLPTVDKGPGISFASAVDQENNAFVVTVTYPSAEAAAAALATYKAKFTAELGYETYLSGFKNLNLALIVGFAYTEGSSSFSVSFSAIIYDAVGSFNRFFTSYVGYTASGLYLPSLPVKGYVDFDLSNFGSFYGLYIVCDDETSASALANEYFMSLVYRSSYVMQTGYAFKLNSDYSLTSVVAPWLSIKVVYATINFGTQTEPDKKPCALIEFFIDSKAKANNDLLSALLGFDDYDMRYDDYFLPTFNNNNFTATREEGETKVTVKYAVKDAETATAHISALGQALVSYYYFTNEEGTNVFVSNELLPIRFSIVLSSKVEEVEGQSVTYVVIEITPIEEEEELPELESYEDVEDLVYDEWDIQLPDLPEGYETFDAFAMPDLQGGLYAVVFEVSYEDAATAAQAVEDYVEDLDEFEEEGVEIPEGYSVYTSDTYLDGYVLVVQYEEGFTSFNVTIMSIEDFLAGISESEAE